MKNRWLNDEAVYKQILVHWNLSAEEFENKIRSANRGYSMPLEWLFEACQYNPENTACEVCGQLNLLFDDCGYFYSVFTKHRKGLKRPLEQNSEYFRRTYGPDAMYLAHCGKCRTPSTAER